MLVYTVKHGDTLWQIAKEYQISLDALLSANPQISDPNYIMPGSRVNIPHLAHMRREAVEERDNLRELEWRQNNGLSLDLELERDMELRRDLQREQKLDLDMEMERDMAMERELNLRAEIGETLSASAMPEPYCTSSSARPCILVTRGGETLATISEEWDIPLAQLHYHNYQYTKNSPLPSGERIIIPVTPDVRINMGNYQQQNNQRNRRRR